MMLRYILRCQLLHKYDKDGETLTCVKLRDILALKVSFNRGNYDNAHTTTLNYL